MSSQPQVKWGGGHTFHVYEAQEVAWHDVPGVYIFAGVDSLGTWEAKYIGQTSSFRKRMPPNHERWSEAHGLGATHIHAKVVERLSARLDLEQVLIRAYDPPLNEPP